MKLLFLIITLVISFEVRSDNSKISISLSKVLPEGMSVKSIKKSQIENIYIVDIGDLQPLYVSKDGEFFFYGELYAIQDNELENTTKQEINLKRKNILDNALRIDDFISFFAKSEKFEVIIFTDVDCGYCRKFHNEMEDFNNLGITVHYLAFPRSGLDSASFDKIVTAWCSRNPKQTLTKMKQGQEVALSLCEDHPVAEHYLLGQKIGITGTPAIIKKNGELLPGYLSPEELLKRLNE
tara:strand:- start:1916 stop:2629 length:714 start_codon:yes stop_codon:yes gene_type:complete